MCAHRLPVPSPVASACLLCAIKVGHVSVRPEINRQSIKVGHVSARPEINRQSIKVGHVSARPEINAMMHYVCERTEFCHSCMM